MGNALHSIQKTQLRAIQNEIDNYCIKLFIKFWRALQCLQIEVSCKAILGCLFPKLRMKIVARTVSPPMVEIYENGEDLNEIPLWASSMHYFTRGSS